MTHIPPSNKSIDNHPDLCLPSAMSGKQAYKTFNLLDLPLKRDMLRKHLDICANRIAHLVSRGHSYAKVCKATGLIKQRMYQVANRKYLNETMLVKLLVAGVVTADDLFMPNLDDLQRYVLKMFVEEHGLTAPPEIDC